MYPALPKGDSISPCRTFELCGNWETSQ